MQRERIDGEEEGECKRMVVMKNEKGRDPNASNPQAFFPPSPAIPQSAPSRSLAVATTPAAPFCSPLSSPPMGLAGVVAKLDPAMLLFELDRWRDEVADEGEATVVAAPGVVVGAGILPSLPLPVMEWEVAEELPAGGDGFDWA